MEQIKQLAGWVRAAHAVVAFTGAGISTESGIPDFRSPGGVWSRHKPVYYDEFIASREARARYWKMRMEAYREFATAQPNAGHIALAELEKAGKLSGIITQNIDGLHQLAGSNKVIELHGTARIVACIACGQETPPEVVHARIEAGEEAPDCEYCGAPLKSRTISFGQQMPAEPMAQAHDLTLSTARKAVGAAGVFLAIGSSLVVEPAASFPRLAKENRARLVIINATETPLDSLADVIFREPIGQTLAALASTLSL
jgi:NAD-dependent deacetylase